MINVRQVRDLRKVELHLHLEGSLGCEGLPFVPTDTNTGTKYESLAAFLREYNRYSSALATVEDYHAALTCVLNYLKEQSCAYAEITVSPRAWKRRGMPSEAVYAGFEQAIREAGSSLPFRPGIVVDLCRNSGPLLGWQILEEAMNWGGSIVGIGLGGDETRYPARPFAEHFHEAMAGGLGTALHVGEADAGVEDVLDVVRTMQPRRVGHCFNAGLDERLRSYLIGSNIAVEVCPSSALRIGLPVTRRTALSTILGCPELQPSVSSDDPALLETDLTNELLVAADMTCATLAQLHGWTDNAVHSSFLTASTKMRLLEYCHEGRTM
jgi:adenosine deaminase